MKRIYDFAPYSDRGGRELARAYGYTRPQDLAADLPAEAVVLGIGAGRSSFGCEIANERPDIQWINIDRRYRRPRKVRQAQAVQGGAIPGNLQYLPGDIMRTKQLPQNVDRVYSSALLPHIIMSSPQRGEQAVHTMASLLKEDGELAIAGFVKYWEDPAVKGVSTRVPRIPSRSRNACCRSFDAPSRSSPMATFL